MMVGNAWNARKKPREGSPCTFIVPGARASLPKTNSVPARAHSRTRIIIEFKNNLFYDHNLTIIGPNVKYV